MQKVRIANIWDNQAKCYIKDQFELRESEKVITGKINISSKVNNSYATKTMKFVAFKSSIDGVTTDAILNSKGQLFEVDLNLAVNKFTDKDNKEITYFQAIINQAKFENKDYQNNISQVEVDDDIPF